jgi:hypothetical protein
MRRLMFLMVALSFLGALSGCGCVFQPRMNMHGICDCEQDDHCASRSPWIRYNTPAVPVETIPPPVKELPSAPKGL